MFTIIEIFSKNESEISWKIDRNVKTVLIAEGSIQNGTSLVYVSITVDVVFTRPAAAHYLKTSNSLHFGFSGDL